MHLIWSHLTGFHEFVHVVVHIIVIIIIAAVVISPILFVIVVATAAATAIATLRIWFGISPAVTYKFFVLGSRLHAVLQSNFAHVSDELHPNMNFFLDLSIYSIPQNPTSSSYLDPRCLFEPVFGCS